MGYNPKGSDVNRPARLIGWPGRLADGKFSKDTSHPMSNSKPYIMGYIVKLAI